MCPSDSPDSAADSAPVQALRVTAFDQPAKLETVQLPALQPGEVRLEVHACALNFADLLMMRGTYQETPLPPFTLGLEVAGRVIATLGDVGDLKIGDRVAAFSGQGGLAATANIAASRCVKLADTLSFEQGAALQIAFGTSHMALSYKARLQPGERLAVTGASGGVGLTAVQIGKLLGAEVIAIARGPQKLEIARRAGADHLIDADLPPDDIRAQLRALGGVDVTYDAVGGALYNACFRATNPDGRMLLIGFAGGELPELRPNHMLVKNITAIGFYWGGYLQFKPEALRASLSWVFEQATAGALLPEISEVYPLEDAMAALERLKSRQATGKIIVSPRKGPTT